VASLLHRGLLVTVGAEQFSSTEITSLSGRGLWTGRVPADGGQVLRLGILSQGAVPPIGAAALRDPMRKWARLVRQRTTKILSITNLLARNLAKSSLRARIDLGNRHRSH
jgi:hypothetical protein